MEGMYNPDYDLPKPQSHGEEVIPQGVENRCRKVTYPS
jgi:hypothetical protein